MFQYIKVDIPNYKRKNNSSVGCPKNLVVRIFIILFITIFSYNNFYTVCYKYTTLQIFSKNVKVYVKII